MINAPWYIRNKKRPKVPTVSEETLKHATRYKSRIEIHLNQLVIKAYDDQNNGRLVTTFK